MNPLTLSKKIIHKIKSLITGEIMNDYLLNTNKNQSNKKAKEPNKKEANLSERNKYGFPRIPR